MIEGANLSSRLRRWLEKVVTNHALPGLAVAVSWDGYEISEGIGSCDASGLLPVTADTMFGVASVTKFLTSLMIMRAQEQKLLKLSDPVSRFFPDLECARDGQMRLHHLLTHTAGFPGLPFRHLATTIPHGKINPSDATDTQTNPMAIKGSQTLENAPELVKSINAFNFDMLGPPGECLSYCNEGYCLLGGIIELVFQCSFAKSADRFVFQPLQMQKSVIGAADLGDRTNIAYPLQRQHQGFLETEFWEAPLFYPAGGLILSVGDMVRLISTLSGETPVLTQSQSRRMILDPQPVASRPSGATAYGYGLELETLDANNTLVWHTGQRPGISSFVGYILEQKLAVALAFNLSDAPSSALGHEIIAHVLDTDALKIDRDSNLCVWPPKADQITVGQLERFCGLYSSPEMGEIRVRAHQNRLLLEFQSTDHELRFDGPCNGSVGEQTFCFLGEGWQASSSQPVTALALDLRIFPRVEA